MVEGLEGRALMATVAVVPLSQPIDATHTHSLSAAMPLAGAGGIVIIEPGAIPEATVNVTLANLTIKGDPNVPGSILPRYDVNVNASGVVLTNLNLGSVTVAATANNLTLSKSQLISFTETGAVSGAGGNVLSQNLITGAVSLGGNSGALQPTSDLLERNSFVSSAPIILQLTNSNGTTIRENTFVGDTTNQIGIQVRSNSDQVSILNNRIDLSGSNQLVAIALFSTGGAAGNIVGARVLDNILNTSGIGTGLYVNIFGNGSTTVAQVEGNDFHGNKVGVDVNGVTGSATGAGNIDLGGGSNSFGVSKGGNNFRGFDGAIGHFAIILHNTDANNTVSAQRNIFDIGANLALVVKDGGNGGGTGAISTTNALNADRSFVQNLYTRFLGRAGDPANGSELDSWVSVLGSKGRAAVVNGIVKSSESLGRIVGRFYINYLGRTADSAGLAGWVGAVQNGLSLEQVEAGFISSPEFLSHINTDFVQALYLNILNRTGSSAELASWNNALPQLGLKGVAASFTTSSEHRSRVILTDFTNFLHRTPSAAEIANLAAFPGDLLAIDMALLGSQEFYDHG